MDLDLTEDEITKRLIAGDQEALAKLFAQSRQRLWRMVHYKLDSKLGSRVDTDDILQESYLAAQKRLIHYKKSSMSPFIWLRSIVQQTIIELYRHHIQAQKRNANKQVAMEQRNPHKSSVILIQIAGNISTPSQAMMREEANAKIQNAIESMSETDKEILLLRHFEELSNNEIAEILGIDPKAASRNENLITS